MIPHLRNMLNRIVRRRINLSMIVKKGRQTKMDMISWPVSFPWSGIFVPFVWLRFVLVGGLTVWCLPVDQQNILCYFTSIRRIAAVFSRCVVYVTLTMHRYDAVQSQKSQEITIPTWTQLSNHSDSRLKSGNCCIFWPIPSIGIGTSSCAS